MKGVILSFDNFAVVARAFFSISNFYCEISSSASNRVVFQALLVDIAFPSQISLQILTFGLLGFLFLPLLQYIVDESGKLRLGYLSSISVLLLVCKHVPNLRYKVIAVDPVFHNTTAISLKSPLSINFFEYPR